MVSLNELQQMAQSAYTGQTLRNIGSFTLFKSTPTLKFYIDNTNIVVSIRGTADSRDVSAWPNVAFGSLDSTSRFQADLQTLLEVQRRYPTTKYSYIGVGHSLGGAILDRFLRMGLIKKGLSYNAAVEPQELKGNPAHRRIYNRLDPLYQIAGYLIPGVEVRPITLSTGIKSLFSSIYGFYAAHLLSNFKGGGKTHTTKI